VGVVVNIDKHDNEIGLSFSAEADIARSNVEAWFVEDEGDWYASMGCGDAPRRSPNTEFDQSLSRLFNKEIARARHRRRLERQK
jgi:hypothetical protein